MMLTMKIQIGAILLLEEGIKHVIEEMAMPPKDQDLLVARENVEIVESKVQCTKLFFFLLRIRLFF